MTDNQDVLGVYLPPGTRVRYDGLLEGGPEYGVVIHCWFDEEIYGYDCYVAFFGKEQPTGPLAQKPYIFRYASVSLMVVDIGKPIEARP